MPGFPELWTNLLVRGRHIIRDEGSLPRCREDRGLPQVPILRNGQAFLPHIAIRNHSQRSTTPGSLYLNTGIPGERTNRNCFCRGGRENRVAWIAVPSG